MNNPLKDSKKTVFATVVGSNVQTIMLHIGDLSDEQIQEQHAEVQKALKTGHTVSWPDGREEWMDVSPVFIPGKQGSDQFKWHADGNRVMHERLLHTRMDGKVSTEILGTIWKRL